MTTQPEKKYFSELANLLLDKSDPAAYNQAIMDFGATICKPAQPLCMACPLNERCIAFQTNTTGKYPVKVNKLIKKYRWFCYIIASYKGKYYIRQRTGKDIWQNLHEFILVEHGREISAGEYIASGNFRELAGCHSIVHISMPYKQSLTHQVIRGYFIHIDLHSEMDSTGYEMVTPGALKSLAFPRFINNYFEAEGHRFLPF